MRRETAVYRWSSLVMFLLVVGCGGGGGGGGGVAALTYTGNTSQAAVVGTNASRLTTNVFGSSNTAGIIAGVSTVGGSSVSQTSVGMVSVTQTLSSASRPVLSRAIRARGQGAVSGVFINETEPCDGGNGSVLTRGTLSDDGTGTLTITFNDCLIATVTLDGEATAQVLAVDLFLKIPTDFIISSPRLTIRGPGVSSDSGGSVRVQISGGTETTTNNLIALNNLTGVMTMGQNLVLVGQAGTVNVTGRIFDNVHGYVDVTTPMLLTFAAPTEVFPSSGRILLAGNTSNVLVEALTSTRVQLSPDFDNVGGADNIALMNWTDLAGPIGVDIGDADGDGIHNSYEDANPPLNRNTMADGAANNDADPPNNLAEYQAGTNPNVTGQ